MQPEKKIGILSRKTKLSKEKCFSALSRTNWNLKEALRLLKEETRVPSLRESEDIDSGMEQQTGT